MASEHAPTVLPQDEHNRLLVSNVHPPDWENPQPLERYNLVVIGAGTAGLVCAAGGAILGARVALVEKYLLGGDCLNMGCVPSKALIRCARAAMDVRLAGDYGIRTPASVEVDFPAVMERMRKLRSAISFHDSARRFKELGVDIYLGEARFDGEDSVRVDQKILRFSKAVVATGARAAQPDIEGLSDAGYLTNETVFSLTDRPGRLAVIGGGPLGCELAQAFSRLGSEVTVFQRAPHLLDREDEDAIRFLQDAFSREGIRVILNAAPRRVTGSGGPKLIVYDTDGTTESMEVDEILVGVGRAPNVENLDLEKAGVEYDTRTGIKVDDHLRTTNSRIYAAGDVCLPYKFTHMADATARIALRNAFFPGNARLSGLTIPWVTYTDPEIAHVGMYARDAERKGIAVETYVKSLGEVDRAILDGETEGFAKIMVARGSDRILGATIVARHAGEMINELTLAMVRGIGLKALSGLIHPYPTQAEAVKGAVDIYNRGRITPFAERLLSLRFRLDRSKSLARARKYMRLAIDFLSNAISSIRKKPI